MQNNLPMAQSTGWLLPQLGFNDIKRQYWAAFGSGDKGRVILQAQVTLKPNNLQHSHQKARAMTTAPREPRSTVCRHRPRTFDWAPDEEASNRIAASCL